MSKDFLFLFDNSNVVIYLIENILIEHKCPSAIQTHFSFSVLKISQLLLLLVVCFLS